ncbi:MAG: hypothetical protein ACJ74Z_14770 [Bryobacteraceae bacterium]
MRLLRPMLMAFLYAASILHAAEVPGTRLENTILPEIGQPTYYWQATAVGHSAQLLTLFCRSCESANELRAGVPLVTILRDTLGDNDARNDRVSYIWLLSYARPNLGQRLLSAVPFFYWRVADGSTSVSINDTAPLLNLTAPRDPVVSEISRNLLQWTMLDPRTMAIRATSRAYRTNQVDHERLHLEEAIGYLRNAPTAASNSALTQTQLDTVIARLELRKQLLGGFVSERDAARVGLESGFEQERIRSRNWELLRQCAEKTGLVFESIDIAGNIGQYAIIWFPLDQSAPEFGSSRGAVWKLLNIKNPWNDSRLKHWSGQQYVRAVSENSSLLPPDARGARQIRLVPLGVYSLEYRKAPLLLVDFRDKLRTRWNEVTQRTINEITAGVIGISHITNWYYYVGADLYNFVRARHGAAVDSAARLDCYSQFRVKLALDHQLDPALRKEMERRVQSLAMNPLEGAPDREIELAQARYLRLQAEAQDEGHLVERLDQDRRAELAEFGETRRAKFARNLLGGATLGFYTHRARKDGANLATLDRERRIEYQLSFLDSLVETGTSPEVAFDSSRIEASVVELGSLMRGVEAPKIRTHVGKTIERLQELSQDAGLQTAYSLTLTDLRDEAPASARAFAGGSTRVAGTAAFIGAGAELHQ